MTIPEELRVALSKIWWMPRDVRWTIVMHYAKNTDFNGDDDDSFPNSTWEWEFGILHGNLDDDQKYLLALHKPKLLVARDKIYGDVPIENVFLISCLESFIYFCEKYPQLQISEVYLEQCATRGNLPIFRYLYESGKLSGKHPEISNKLIECSATGGHFEFTKYLYEKVYKNNLHCTSNIIRGAAERGNVEIIDYAYNVIFEKDPLRCYHVNAIDFAARSGHLGAIKYIYEIIYDFGKRNPGVAFNKSSIIFAEACRFRDVAEYLKTAEAGGI